MSGYPDPPTSALVAQDLISLFFSRKGFEEWWEEIDPNTQAEIVSEIEAIVAKHA